MRKSWMHRSRRSALGVVVAAGAGLSLAGWPWRRRR